MMPSDQLRGMTSLALDLALVALQCVPNERTRHFRVSESHGGIC